MAKTRSRSKKSASSSTAKKKKVSKPSRGPRKAAKPKRVELRGVRTKIREHVATLRAVEQPSDKVRDSLERLNRVLGEMEEICGPNMIIPLE